MEVAIRATEILDLILSNEANLVINNKGRTLVARIKIKDMYSISVNSKKNGEYEVLIGVPHRGNAVEIYNIKIDKGIVKLI